jgi:hypothetical protein
MKIKVCRAMRPVTEQELIEINVPFFYRIPKDPLNEMAVVFQNEQGEPKMVKISVNPHSGRTFFSGPTDFGELPANYDEIFPDEFQEQLEKVVDAIENTLKLI